MERRRERSEGLMGNSGDDGKSGIRGLKNKGDKAPGIDEAPTLPPPAHLSGDGRDAAISRYELITGEVVHLEKCKVILSDFVEMMRARRLKESKAVDWPIFLIPIPAYNEANSVLSIKAFPFNNEDNRTDLSFIKKAY